MCGIIGLFNIQDEQKMRSEGLGMARKIRHRGPDWSGSYSDEFCVLMHERLSIVDVEHGAQPLYDIIESRVLAVNGEIYNHKELSDKLNQPHKWQTHSDCEILLYLFDEYGIDFLNDLDGIFAFCLYDPKKREYFIARDHIGIIPLYIGWDEKDMVYVSSELKAIEGKCDKLQEFPPGYYYLGSDNKFIKWYDPSWSNTIPDETVSLKKLRKSLEDSVKKQLMCDVPYGVLLSGGLDSSLIAAIAASYSKKRIESENKEDAWWPRMHSFAIGLKNSPDLASARIVADAIGTVHHECLYTLQEGIDALHDVIYYLETYDVTTIRAATPMYLMARKIKSMGIKMVLSGEGADEVFGGYLYFHMAPNKEEFHNETVRKLQKLSKYDCLRANKSMAAWGIEARVPFLGKDFLEYAMKIDPIDKMCIDGKSEKHLLRKAFEGLIPDEVLWRQKEQFSDGVGYEWIDGLKSFADKHVSDQMLKDSAKNFMVNPPETKEAYYYRSIFSKLFKSDQAANTVETGPSIACSSPVAFRWSKEFQKMGDPSGRAIKIHQKSVDKV